MRWKEILKKEIELDDTSWQDVIKTSLQDFYNKLSPSQQKELENHIKAGINGQKAIEMIQMKYGLGRYANKPKPPESAWRERTF